MPQIKLTPKALADMARLQNFYRAKSPAAYMGVKRVLRDGLQRLSQYPEIGRICPEYPEYREWIVSFGSSGFIFLYAINDEECLILAARHQSEVGYSLISVC